jgi:hypothetical protein
MDSLPPTPPNNPAHNPFASWALDTLAKFALEANTRLLLQEQALDQYRKDLRDAMALTRKQYTTNTTNTDDWK